MTLKSRAVVLPRRNAIELREVEVIPPRGGDVLVRTAYTSISAGTERMLLDGRMPHPALSFPVVPGYETVGRIVEVGAQVPREMLGQWVYVGGARCFKGVNPAWGGQSMLITTDAERVIPLRGVPPEHGVLLALAATALHGVDLAQVRATDRVLVLGQGIVGQLTARLIQRLGPASVTVSDRIPSRLAVAQADRVVDVSKEALEDVVPGASIDLLVEATGKMKVLTEALPLLADHGRVLLLGYYDHIDIPYAPVFMREATLLVAREWKHGPQGDLPRVRDMMDRGELDVRGLLTHRVPLERIQAAYRVALEEPDCLKVVVEWPE